MSRPLLSSTMGALHAAYGLLPSKRVSADQLRPPSVLVRKKQPAAPKLAEPLKYVRYILVPSALKLTQGSRGSTPLTALRMSVGAAQVRPASLLVVYQMLPSRAAE